MLLSAVGSALALTPPACTFTLTLGDSLGDPARSKAPLPWVSDLTLNPKSSFTASTRSYRTACSLKRQDVDKSASPRTPRLAFEETESGAAELE
jgi:hypothetical protein